MFAHGTTVTIQRASTTTDRYGNTIPGPYVDVEDIDGCAVAPRESSEDNTNRTALVVGVTVFAPYGADVRKADRCVIDGRTYQVEGEPAAWSHPMTGWQPGTVIQLRIVEG